VVNGLDEIRATAVEFRCVRLEPPGLMMDGISLENSGY
jgi:hypothetical protein